MIFDIASFNDYLVSDDRDELVLNFRSSVIMCKKDSQLTYIALINKHCFVSVLE